MRIFTKFKLLVSNGWHHFIFIFMFWWPWRFVLWFQESSISSFLKFIQHEVVLLVVRLLNFIILVLGVRWILIHLVLLEPNFQLLDLLPNFIILPIDIAQEEIHKVSKIFPRFMIFLLNFAYLFLDAKLCAKNSLI